MRRLRASLSSAALVVLGSALALACTSSPAADGSAEGVSEITSGSALTEEALRRWDDYVARETSDVALQEDCKPRRLSPPAGTTARGVVVLFHGFTACPQQFFDMAVDLNAAGFEVLLPLLPGQGRVPRFEGAERTDDVSALPTQDDRARYVQLAAEMSDIARLSRGVRVVGGLSMGGMVATAALVEGADVWSRGILFAPFFGPPGRSGWAARIGGTLLPWMRTGWGASCETNAERAGICQFLVGSLDAAREVGEEIRARASSIRAAVQVVGVTFDPSADNKYAAQLLDDLPGRRDACFYPKGTPHAFVTRRDHPELDNAWLPGLYRATTAFVARGAPFATSGVSEEYGYGTCAP